MGKLSLAQRIFRLVSGIRDPVLRIDVASSINFLADIYTSGRASKEEVLKDLEDVCYEIFKKTMASEPDEVIKERAKNEAKELLEAMKLTSLRRRLTSKYSSWGASE